MPIPTPMRPDFAKNPLVFLKEVKTELNKVIWPSREEVVKLTLVVLAVSIMVGLYIGGLDLLLTKFTDVLVRR